MRLAAIASLLAVWAVACGGEAPITTAEAEAMEFQAAQEDLTVTTATPVAATDILVGDVTPILGFGDVEPDTGMKGKAKCTAEKQLVCDACVSNCDGLCAQPGGGGSGVGCVGLFCPNKCQVCQLSCYASCGKCMPTIFK